MQQQPALLLAIAARAGSQATNHQAAQQQGKLAFYGDSCFAPDY
jgi:hypothetical protein